MSYEILYNKQFLRCRDGRYLPLICSGCNNLRDENGKVVREWWNIARQFNKIVASSMEILDKAWESEYNQVIVKNGKWLSNDEWKRQLKSALKNAMTFKEFFYYGNTMRIWGCKDLRCSPTHYISSEKEFYESLAMIDQEMKFFEDTDSWQLEIDINYGDEKIKKPKKVNTAKEKQQLKEDYYIIFAPEYNAGFKRKTNWGCKLSMESKDWRKFKTHKEAENYLRKNPLSIKVEILHID